MLGWSAFPQYECELKLFAGPSDQVNVDGLVNKSEYEEVGSQSFCGSS